MKRRMKNSVTSDRLSLFFIKSLGIAGFVVGCFCICWIILCLETEWKYYPPLMHGAVILFTGFAGLIYFWANDMDKKLEVE